MAIHVGRHLQHVVLVVALLLGLLPLLAGEAGAATTEPAVIYLVALDDNGQSGIPVGCGDSLIAVNVEVPAAGTIEGRITAVLEYLFALHDPDYGESGLYNTLYENTLVVDAVAVGGGTAAITLSGNPMSRGTCDDPRIEGQIVQTVLQFPGIVRVSIIANGGPLFDARGPRSFPETGQDLWRPFLGFWELNGGIPVFGFPISDQRFEGVHKVQYFERQRIELQPENAAPFDVLLGRLGYQIAEQQGLLATAPFQRQQPNGNANCEFVPETGHHLCFGFRAWWHSHGLDFGDPGISYRESLLLFGYPISDEFVVNGRTVQYFERARFEWHPENQPPWDILLGRLGADVYSGP